MSIRCLAALVLALIFWTNTSKGQDSLWVRLSDGDAYVSHKSKVGETLFMIAKKYAVPPALLADLNDLEYSSGIPSGTLLKIPVSSFNYHTQGLAGQRLPIAYKPRPSDDLATISRIFSVSQGAIQRLNDMPDNRLVPGKTLHLGWVSYDASVTPFPEAPAKKEATKQATGTIEKTPPPIKTKDAPIEARTRTVATTPPPPTKQPVDNESLFYGQSGSLQEGSGAAVFYTLKTALPEGTFYALHKTAKKGSIVKVSNPANGNVIYAKVIGTLPSLKIYHNAIIAISSNAARELESREKKMFCNITFLEP